MKNLVAVPLLVLAFMLQTTVVSQITLLSGAADLVLVIIVAWSLQEQVQSSWHWAALAGLMGAFVSGLPPFVLFLAYLFAALMSRYVLRQIWHTPILALFTVTFFSTLGAHLITFAALALRGNGISIGDALALITLPSLFLNLLIALPVHSFMRDLALWVYPLEEMV